MINRPNPPHIPLSQFVRVALCLLAAATLLVGCGGGDRGKGSSGAPDDATSEGQLRELLTQIAAESDWDLSGDLVWGYYFFNREKSPLEILGNRLAGEGYRVVNIFENKDDNKSVEYGLHLERVEHHNLESITKRSEEMRRLATESGIDQFDGVDVAPVEGISEGYEQVWWTYLADYDGKPGSVSLNLGLKKLAPMSRYSTLLVTGLNYTAKDDKGLPDDQEMEFLEQVRFDRITFLKLNTPAVEAGGVMLNGEELHYIYLRDPTGVQEMLQDYYDANFPDRKSTITIKSNIDWEAYIDLLYPNEATISYYEKELKEQKLWQFVSDEEIPETPTPPEVGN